MNPWQISPSEAFGKQKSGLMSLETQNFSQISLKVTLISLCYLLCPCQLFPCPKETPTIAVIPILMLNISSLVLTDWGLGHYLASRSSSGLHTRHRRGLGEELTFWTPNSTNNEQEERKRKKKRIIQENLFKSHKEDHLTYLSTPIRLRLER